MSDEPSPFVDGETAPPSQPLAIRQPSAARADFRRSTAPDPQRLLPASVDAEMGVLSSYLLMPAEVGLIFTERGCGSHWFHTPGNAIIYRTLMDAWGENRFLDIVTLTQELHDRRLLDEAGGAAYISSLFTFLPTAANAEYYLDILKDKHIGREMIRVGTEFTSRAYDEQDRVQENLDAFEQRVLAIREDRREAHITGAKDAVMAAMLAIQTTYESRGAVTGLETGFQDLDALTDGLHRGEMIVIAARPSQGKTALAMNIVEYLAVDRGIPVGIFTIEMTRNQLVQRMLCSRARVNLHRIRDGSLSDRDFPALTAAASKIAAAPIYFDESSDITIQEIRGRARRMQQQYGIEAVFIDYLQLVHSSSPQAKFSREREVSDVSSGCKAMAKELGLPVVVLAQMAREFEKRGPRARPRLSDLRESGSIEQDADVIEFLVRSESYAETDDEREALAGQAELIIAKQRNGPVGDIPLTFLKEYTRFETRAETDGEDRAQPGLGI